MSRRTELLLAVVPVAVLWVVHLVMLLPREIPLISADEFAYLGYARALVGQPILHLNGGAPYYPGYSLAIAPVVYFFEDPAAQYTAIVVFNSLILSLLYLPLRYIARHLAGLTPRWAAVVSLTASLMPACLIQPTMAQAESLLLILWPFTVVLLHRLLVRPTYVTGVAFSVVVVWLTATHLRTAPVLVVAFAFLVTLTVRRRLPWRVGLAALAPLVAAGIGGYLLLGSMHQVLGSHKLNGLVSHSTDLMVWAARGRTTLQLLKRLAGQAWYLLVATGGLAALGSGWLAWRVTRRAGRRDTPSRLSAWYACLFAVLAMSGAFLLSAIKMTYAQRVDHLIYGRYNEAFATLLVVFGLGALVAFPRPRLRGLALRAGVMMLLVAGASFLLAPLVGSPRLEPTNIANVMSLTPWITWHGLDHMPRVIWASSAVALGVAVTTLALARWCRVLVVVPAVALFVLATGYAQTDFVRPLEKGRLDDAALFAALPRYPVEVSYVGRLLWREVLIGQFVRPEIRFSRYRSRPGDLPPGRFVLAHAESAYLKRLGAVRHNTHVERHRAMFELPHCSQSLTRGLRGYYATDPNLAGTEWQTRIDPALAFRWGRPQRPPVPDDGALGAFWEGDLVAPGPGWYVLETIAEGGVQLWLDGRKVIDDWQGQGRRVHWKSTRLEPERPAALLLRYRRQSPGGSLRLRWRRPRAARARVISPAALRPTGLGGAYFRTATFAGTPLFRVDARVDATTWHQRAPTRTVLTAPLGVRWAGRLQPRDWPTTTLHVVAAGRVRLWLGDQLLIDGGDPAAGPREHHTQPQKLEPGRDYPIKLEYAQVRGEPAIQLRWSGPSGRQEVIPTHNLRLPTEWIFPACTTTPEVVTVSGLRAPLPTAAPGATAGDQPTKPPRGPGFFR